MGGCGSSAKDDKAGMQAGGVKYLGKGSTPKKINRTKNPHVNVPDIVYLFGGSKILQFNTKTRTISELPAQPTVTLPKRTQCEFIPELQKIATVGGTQDGKPSKLGYLFDPKDWTKAQALPAFPVPIRYTTLAYVNGTLYTIGGETEGVYPENLLKDVYALKLKPEIGKAWEKVTELTSRRRSANVVVASDIIHVFGGLADGGAKGLRTTAIDLVDLKTKKTTQADYRLPLGVEGARMCWNGDDILLIGGMRDENKPDANVVLLDFEKKAIMSLR